MLRYIVSMMIMLDTLILVGQIEVADTNRVRPPKPPKVKKELREFIPTGVKFGVDFYSFSRNFWDESKTLQEYQVDIDFRHYFLAFEYGNAKVEELETDFSYENKGAYFRIGPEVNFMHDPSKLHAIYLGFRYASSTFDDQLTYQTEDAFGTTQISAFGDNSKAQWAEMVTGTKVNLWKGLFIGFAIRYKFLKSVKESDLVPYWIPGFGTNDPDDKDQFGFSYYLWWRFGFRKPSVPASSEPAK